MNIDIETMWQDAEDYCYFLQEKMKPSPKPKGFYWIQKGDKFFECSWETQKETGKTQSIYYDDSKEIMDRVDHEETYAIDKQVDGTWSIFFRSSMEKVDSGFHSKEDAILSLKQSFSADGTFYSKYTKEGKLK